MELTASAARVQAAAVAAGLDIRVVEMPASTRTAAEAAAACGCDVAQIVKSLVFLGNSTGKPYLLLVSGPNRVDETAMARHLGEPLQRADADTVRAVTGFAIGGVAPLGHPVPLATAIDEDLLRFDVVWAAAGTPRAVFSVAPRALAEVTNARVLRVN